MEYIFCKKDRQAVQDIINKFTMKKYCIDQNGFLRADPNSIEDTKKSKIYSQVIDDLLHINKKVIISISSGWSEYDCKEGKIATKSFTNDKKLIKFGESNTDQLVIADCNDKDGMDLLENLKKIAEEQNNKKYLENENNVIVNKENQLNSVPLTEESGEKLNSTSKREEKENNGNANIIKEETEDNTSIGNEESKDEKGKNKTESTDIFSIAIAGLLGNKDTELSNNIEEYKNIIPKGNGIWILDKDRQSIINIINKFASKQYYVDENGFLKLVENSIENSKKSKTYSEILDKLISSDKKLIIGRNDGWHEYDTKEGKIVNKKFTDTNKGVNIGGIKTDQLVIINSEELDKDKNNIAFVLFHELVHGLRGEQGRKNRLEEELFAGELENNVRKEMGDNLRDTYELEEAYKNYNAYYGDDWKRKALLYEQSYFGTVRLNDPSSGLNIRSGASTATSAIGSLTHGTVVTILGKESNWYKISYNGKVGYIREDFIVLGGSSTGGTGGTGTVRLNDPSSSLNIRSGASTSTSVIGSLTHGTVVTILGKESNWYKISYNGKVGYVREDFIVLGGSSTVGSDGTIYGNSLKEGYIRYYAQDDPRYGNTMYSNHGDRSQTIANSACGAAAFSIVVSTLNNLDIPPTEICRYALAKGCRTYNSGTSASLFSIASRDSSNPKYSLNYEAAGSVSRVKSLLSDNKHLVIASMRSGHVTRQGHYIVLAGCTTVNGKVYFKVYDPHRWNEYYIYDGEIIDTVKDDGFILLSEKAVLNEGQGFYAFSNKSNSVFTKPSNPSTNNKPTKPTSNGSSNGSSNNGSSKPSSTVNTKSVVSNFLLGVKDAGTENAKGVWDFIKDPIQGIQGVAEGVKFLAQANQPGSQANIALAKMAEKVIEDFSTGDANANARRIGRITGEILICVLIDHGAKAIATIIQDSGKLSGITKLIEKAKGGKINTSEIKDALEGGVCFTENTLISTEQGYKPIKDIKIGDKVYSENANTKEIALKEVKKTFVKEKDKLVNITLGNEVIEATETHPFYVQGKGWVLAKNLIKDDKLISKDKIINIEKVEIKTLENNIKVYNFEVEDWHTYFVGQNSVLVHNRCSEVVEGATEAGKLKSIGNGLWESTEGLIYDQGSKQGNRVLHVLEHASPDPTKPLHSVFNVSKDKVLGVVDEAWSMRSGVTPALQKNGNQVFNIPMGKVVGTNGETLIRIVVKNGTSEVVTAFPVK